MILANAQSALDPGGPQAAHIKSLWWLFHTILSVVYSIVVIVMLVAIFRRREPGPNTTPEIKPEPAGERRMTMVVASAVGVTVAILFVLLISEFVTERRLFAMTSEPAREITVTGRQWWWDIQYQDKTASNTIVTANEIHIPIGAAIKFNLVGADVIHSFWVPSLHGKKDAIPGHPSQLWLRADKAGTYDGQCAEFCGHQHAKMRFKVIAQSQVDFDVWCQEQRQSAHEPTTDAQKRGKQVFISTTCITCHAIQGTPANGRVGPNLTHVGGRESIAANSLPNDAETLAKWIQDPHQFKPGVRMPQNNISDQDVQALAAYLKSLK